jgi:hypothetical protein
MARERRCSELEASAAFLGRESTMSLKISGRTLLLMRRKSSLLAALVCLAHAALAQALVFTQIATESSAGVTILTEPPPALNEGGDVVFLGANGTGTQVLLVGNGGPLTTINIASHGLRLVTGLRVDNAGHIAFTATRSCGAMTCRGAYAIDTSGSNFAILLELPLPFPPTGPIVRPSIGLSPNGTVAFSSINNGQGAIYRGPVTGSPTQLRTGTGQFYNTQQLDVNDAGTVAVQMEYSFTFLRRGILLFDQPGQSFGTLRIAIAELSISQQPLPAINSFDNVAFRLGSVVNKAYPVPFGDPPYFFTIADMLGDYSDFRRVVLNDNLVLFEAKLGAADFGIYSSWDPVAGKILEPYDPLGASYVSTVVMGHLTNSGGLSVVLTDISSPEAQVWRIDGVI